MEVLPCKKCKCETPIQTPHKCMRCKYRLCRKCDDSSMYLSWYEVNGVEEPDEYLCEKCIKKAKTPKSELVRDEERQATAGNAYTHKPSVPSS